MHVANKSLFASLKKRKNTKKDLFYSQVEQVVELQVKCTFAMKRKRHSCWNEKRLVLLTRIIELQEHPLQNLLGIAIGICDLFHFNASRISWNNTSQRYKSLFISTSLASVETKRALLTWKGGTCNSMIQVNKTSLISFQQECLFIAKGRISF